LYVEIKLPIYSPGKRNQKCTRKKKIIIKPSRIKSRMAPIGFTYHRFSVGQTFLLHC